MSKNKGITLIALVVTIIILLILAGISISMISGDGLFGRAKKASAEYTRAAEQEQSLIEGLDFDDYDSYDPNTNLPENVTNGNLAINLNVTSYNSTLKSFPVVIGVVETKDSEILHVDITACEVTGAGRRNVNANIPLVNGADIHVMPIYTGGSYSPDSTSYELKVNENKVDDVDVEIQYDYRTISSSGTIITF